jgi:hypothetical protein
LNEDHPIVYATSAHQNILGVRKQMPTGAQHHESLIGLGKALQRSNLPLPPRLRPNSLLQSPLKTSTFLRFRFGHQRRKKDESTDSNRCQSKKTDGVTENKPLRIAQPTVAATPTITS